MRGLARVPAATLTIQTVESPERWKSTPHDPIASRLQLDTARWLSAGVGRW